MLTDTHCRNANPKPRLYRLTDHRGRCLEVKPSGVKSWRYRFTLEGKASMFALGVTKNRRLDMQERVLFGEIGQMPIRAVTRAHVLGILQHTVKRGAPTVAAEARRTMSVVFEYTVATLRADSDPVWPVRKALPANTTQHKKRQDSEVLRHGASGTG